MEEKRRRPTGSNNNIRGAGTSKTTFYNHKAKSYALAESARNTQKTKREGGKGNCWFSNRKSFL